MTDSTKSPSEKKDSIPFYPDHIRTEARVVMVLLGLALMVGIIGLLLPVGLGAPADPMDTPAHTKPEWYFLGLYQLLKFVSKTAGALIPVIGVGLLFLLPFLDRKPDASARSGRIRMIGAAVLLVVIAALTVWGEFS